MFFFGEGGGQRTNFRVSFLRRPRASSRNSRICIQYVFFSFYRLKIRNISSLVPPPQIHIYVAFSCTSLLFLPLSSSFSKNRTARISLLFLSFDEQRKKTAAPIKTFRQENQTKQQQQQKKKKLSSDSRGEKDSA